MTGNCRANDLDVIKFTTGSGWRCSVIWERAMKGKTKSPRDALFWECAKWLKGSTNILEISGL
jgi:hypothetical protein